MYTKGDNPLAIANIQCIININHFSDYDKLINVPGRVLNAFARRSIVKVSQGTEADDFHWAEMFCKSKLDVV